jgi:hypothetical protein
MHKKPEKRNVVDETNPEGGYNNEKIADVQEKPEKRDDIDVNSNLNFDPDAKHVAGSMHAGKSLEEDAEWVTRDGREDEDTSESKDEAPKNQEDNITYFIRQSSTKPEAVRRYVDCPVSNQVVHFVTPLFNPGLKKPETRNGRTDTNPEGRDDEGKMVEKQVHKQPEKRDVMVDINSNGKHGNEKTVEKPLYEKSDWRDMMIDINPEGKYDKEEVAEKQLVATGDAPSLGREGSIAEDWKMKAETRLVQGDGLDDTKEAIKTNEEDVDCACISSETKNKELVLSAEKSSGAKGIDEDAEEEADTEVGTSVKQEKPLADNTYKAEKLDIVEEVEMKSPEDKTDDGDPDASLYHVAQL